MFGILCLLQDLEKQESHFQSYSNAQHSKLQAEIIELEEIITNGHDNKSLMDGLDHSLSKSAEEENSARKVICIVMKYFVLLLFEKVPCNFGQTLLV